MKKPLSVFLALILLVTMATVPVSASETMNSEPEVVTALTTFTDSDVAPDPFYPFIYNKEWNYAWLGQELEQKIAELNPGHLYIANLETNDVIEVFDEPVNSYECSSQYIFAETASHSIVRLDYSGQGHTILYTSISGALDALEYEDRMLYFTDDSLIIQMDTQTGATAVILEKDSITTIYPYKTGHLLLTNESGQQFEYNINKNQISLISGEDEIDALLNTTITTLVAPKFELTWDVPEADATIQALSNTYINLPMSEYPAGSYFTTTGTACSNHNRCKYYASTNQCDGFARYVNEHYYHVSGSTWSTPYSVYGDIVSPYSKYQAFGDTTTLYQFFNQLETGAYVRVSKRNRVQDSTDPYTAQGSHSFVYISHDNNGAILYEANLDGTCGVSYGYRDFDELLTRYPYFFGWVNHDQEGTVVNSTDRYHRIHCSHSGCGAYVVEIHTYVSTSTGYECIVCGDLTNDPLGPIIMQ